MVMSFPNPSFLSCALIFGLFETVIVVVLCSNQQFSSLTDTTSPYHHSALLAQGRYRLQWFVDWTQRRVTFNITVATTGYVGFGLARRGKMAGADLIIGGVDQEGKPYFTDRHAVGNQLPVLDKSQDWTLHSAWERGGQTFLSFSRPFDTCDATQDIPITGDSLTLIWAYSEVDDEVRYHYQNRGGYTVYILDPDLSPNPQIPVESTGVQVFRMSTQLKLLPRDTTYWCTFHKIPTTTKHHIIGFDVKFPTLKDRSHVHHILIHRCKVPQSFGVDPSTVFEAPARSGGGECYLTNWSTSTLPLRYCSDVIHAWAIGGRTVFFPDHVGIPMGSIDGQYFMVQTHLDNPNSIPNINVTVTVEAFYTSQLRENDVSHLEVGTGKTVGSFASLLIPPNSLDHATLVHCAGGCTQRIVVHGGISVFGGVLHTHQSGRKVRLMQIRRNGQQVEELPWVLYDDNYRVGFQQVRMFREERRVLPGDQLILSCEYDTTGRNASVAIGGLSAKDEMCVALLYYYVPSKPRSPPQYHLCTSEIRAVEYWNRLGLKGVHNVTWDHQRFQIVLTGQQQFKGVRLVDYANNQVRWGLQMRDQVQWDQLNLPHLTICPAQSLGQPETQAQMIQQPVLIQTQTVEQNANFIQNNGVSQKLQFGPLQSSLTTSQVPQHPLQIVQTRRVSPAVTTSLSSTTRQLRRFSGSAWSGNDNQNSEIFVGGGQSQQSLYRDAFVSTSPKNIFRYRRPPQCTGGQKDI